MFLDCFFHEKYIFDEKTYIVSPVFVSKEHWGKGIATKLLNMGLEDMLSQGYKVGLETQNPDNVKFYERFGFSVKKEEFYKLEKIHNYWCCYSYFGGSTSADFRKES